MLMWFCDGTNLPDDCLPLPNGDFSAQELNYYTVLKETYQKLKKANTPVYLLYLGTILTNAQRESIQFLNDYADGFENLYIIDVINLEKYIKDERIITKVSLLIRYYKNYHPNTFKHFFILTPLAVYRLSKAAKNS